MRLLRDGKALLALRDTKPVKPVLALSLHCCPPGSRECAWRVAADVHFRSAALLGPSTMGIAGSGALPAGHYWSTLPGPNRPLSRASPTEPFDRRLTSETHAQKQASGL